MGSANPEEEGQYLESWKEIAAYLGVEVRTAQRYEVRDGLPVLRDMRGTRGTIRARRDEIDRWLLSRRIEPTPSQPPPAESRQTSRKWILVAGIAVVSIVAFAALARVNRPKPDSAIPPLGRLFATLSSSLNIGLDDVPSHLAFHPDGRRLFLTSQSGEKVWVISTSSWQITHTIPLGTPPAMLRFSDDGSTVFTPTQRGVAAIDTGTLAVKHFDLRGPLAAGIAVAGDRLYVAQGRSGMNRIHLPNGKVETIPGLICPYYPMVDPNSNRLYVASRCGGPQGRPGHDTVDILDLRTERSIGSTRSGPPLVAQSIVPTPAFDHLWLNGADACRAPFYDHEGCPVVPGSVLHLYRTSDGSFVKTFGWSHWVFDIVPHPDGKRVVLVTGNNGGSLQVLSSTGFHLLEELPLPGVSAAAFSPDGRLIAAASGQARKLLVFQARAPECEPAENGLVSFWSADGTFDDNVRYHLRSSGGVNFARGLLGSAFRFGPERCVVEQITQLAPVNGQDDLTVAAWLNPEIVRGSVTVIDSKFSHQPGRWKLSIEADGRLHLSTAQKVTLSSKAAIPPGQWTHFAVVKSSDRLALFVNGQVESSEEFAFALPPGFAIGSGHGPGTFYRGLVDEIVHYDRALTAAEVKSLYELPRKQACAEFKNLGRM